MRARIRISPLRVLVYVLIGFLYVPIVVVVVFAFNSSANLSWPIRGLSFRWFNQVFTDPAFSTAFFTSVRVSLLVAFLCVATAFSAAILFVRRPSRASRVLQGFSLVPAMMPPLFIAIALFTAMSYAHVQPSLITIVLGQVVVTIPFVLTVIMARLQQFDVDLEAAARDLGAGPAQVVRRITLPIVMPTLVGAALLAFAFSFDEVLVTNFTSGTNVTLPLYTFSKFHRTIDPSVNAVATLLLVIPWLLLAAAAPFIVSKRSRVVLSAEEEVSQ